LGSVHRVPHRPRTGTSIWARWTVCDRYVGAGCELRPPGIRSATPTSCTLQLTGIRGMLQQAGGSDAWPPLRSAGLCAVRRSVPAVVDASGRDSHLWAVDHRRLLSVAREDEDPCNQVVTPQKSPPPSGLATLYVVDNCSVHLPLYIPA
jgi:hypothetical protein